jgi:hypothetical protein
MEFLQRSIEDERSVIVQLTEKEKLKEQAKPIPEN